MKLEEIPHANFFTWAKFRALQYIEIGEVKKAFDWVSCDLSKHPEIIDYLRIELGLTQILMGELTTREQMREFINGFN